MYYQRNNPSNLAFGASQIEPINRQEISKKAVELKINSLRVDLPIVESSIRGGQWEVTNQGVSHLGQSPEPGQRGNSIIYGHNWNNLLGSLVKIKPGQSINIKYDDGSQKNFEVIYTQVVKPTDVGILKQTSDKRITLYTCTGLFDSQRFVAVATTP